MSASTSLPTVVIVGRPNVGKSTFFNAVTGTRRAIVGDEPGITRDRIHVEAEHAGKRFELIDTGGIIPDDGQLIPSQILKQARVALDRAAHVVFLIDGRTEITAADRDLAMMLRRLGKPVALAVNKIDAQVRESLAHDFYSLGFEHLFPVSSEHRIGIDDLLDHVTAGFPRADESSPSGLPRIKVAIIGRPNTGKSTLLNALSGSERSIVTPEAGTTRDAVDETVVQDGVEFVFVDTAGIRRKGKTKAMAEKLSVVMARRHIELANVVIVMTDAVEGVVALDATIAGYAHEAGKPVILCVNKWDLAADKNKARGTKKIRDATRFLDYAPVAFLSARSGAGVKQLFGLIRRGWECTNKRVTTGELNRFFEKLEKDGTLKIRYLTQVRVRPPTFVAFKDDSRPLHFSTERFLVNRIRETFGFAGVPVVLRTKVKPQKEKLPRR